MGPEFFTDTVPSGYSINLGCAIVNASPFIYQQIKESRMLGRASRLATRKAAKAEQERARISRHVRRELGRPEKGVQRIERAMIRNALLWARRVKALSRMFYSHEGFAKICNDAKVRAREAVARAPRYGLLFNTCLRDHRDAIKGFYRPKGA